MEREVLIEIISEKIKLIRTEYNYTQEQMADLLGISKKTLVQIEKKRVDCGWTVAIAVCTLFRKSTILQVALGGNPLLFMELIAMGGTIKMTKNDRTEKFWWKTIENNQNWRIQQNLMTTCYRLIRSDQHSVLYTFSKEIAFEELKNAITNERVHE